MKFQDLYVAEAPLVDFDEINQDKANPSFDPSSRRALNLYLATRKYRIVQMFKNTPYDFKIYVRDNNANPLALSQGDLKNLQSVVNITQDEFLGIDPQYADHMGDITDHLDKSAHRDLQDSTAIVVILTHNEGANSIALSPWIVAHRVAHALIEQVNPFKRLANTGTSLAHALSNIYGILDDYHRVLPNAPWAQKQLQDLLKSHNNYTLLTYFGNTQSLRDQKQQNVYGEIFVEFLTQYIVRGNIATKSLPFMEVLKKLHLNKSHNVLYTKYTNLEIFVENIFTELNNICEKTLQQSVGKVFVL